MNVNGITSTQAAAAYGYSSKVKTKENTAAKTDSAAAQEAGVIYEPSTESQTDSVKKTYTPDTNLINKLKAYRLQDQGMDTVEANIALGFKADLREYGTGASILADLGVKKLILMTNNPMKITGLDGYGIEIVGRDPIEMTCNEKNEFYLYTKYRKMGHLLHVKH